MNIKNLSFSARRIADRPTGRELVNQYGGIITTPQALNVDTINTKDTKKWGLANIKPTTLVYLTPGDRFRAIGEDPNGKKWAVNPTDIVLNSSDCITEARQKPPIQRQELSRNINLKLSEIDNSWGVPHFPR